MKATIFDSFRSYENLILVIGELVGAYQQSRS